MQQLALLWGVRYPRLRSRLERAVALTGGVTPRGEGVWEVESTEGRVYEVQADPVRRESACTCIDFRRGGGRCKHQLAVALVWASRGEGV